MQNYLIDDLLKRDIYAETQRVKQFIYSDPKNQNKNYVRQQIDKATINAKVTTLLSKQGKIMQRDLSPSEQLDALLEPVDYSQSFQILNQKLEQSTQFLSSLLQ